VLAADDDHLIRLADPEPQVLAPDIRGGQALGAAQHLETGARGPGLGEKQFEEFPIVFDVEADEYTDLAHTQRSSGSRQVVEASSR
jgi:hypothetical protein